jgi:hypothetical protein
MPFDLGPISMWPTQPGRTGKGLFLLTGFGEHVGSSGQACLRMTLEDAEGRATGFIWPEARTSVVCPPTPCPVFVTGTVQQFQGHQQLKVHALAPADPDQVPTATMLLPRSRCPECALPALDRLEQLELELPDPLNGFLRNVLLDPAIGLPFLRCRSSVRHHHQFVGGLLVHSTEMLDQAASATRQIIPDDEWSPHLAQVGYLLHDLGKLQSVGEVRRPRYALVVRHEFTTIEMLAPHLRWLEQRNAQLAMALRYLFAFLATPAKSRGIPEHVIAEVVVTLDQWSAAAHNHRDLGHLLNRVPPTPSRIGHAVGPFAHSHSQSRMQSIG